MANIEVINNFINNNKETNLIINQVSDEIGLFYLYLVEYYAYKQNIKLIQKDTFIESENDDLFGNTIINVCYSNNKKNIETFLNSNAKCLIITDYKNYKIYSKSFRSVNGYNYQKDIEHYLKKIMNIDNSEILEYCLSSPFLIYSELSKYLINQANYLKESEIKEDNNFILEIRKNIFNLKRNNNDIKNIYFKLKEEIKYKKFNFLIF